MTIIYRRFAKSLVASGRNRQRCPICSNGLIRVGSAESGRDGGPIADAGRKQVKLPVSVTHLLGTGALLLCTFLFPASIFAQSSPGESQKVSETATLDLSVLDDASQAKSSVPPTQGNTPAAPAASPSGPPSSTGTTDEKAESTPTVPPAKSTGGSGNAVSSGSTTVWELVLAGGWIGVIIFMLSLYACMRVVQFCLAFRRSELMPQDTCREVSQLVESGRLRQAIQCCDDDGSAYARIVSSALGQADGGWSAVEQAAQDALTEEAASMYRRVEVLSVVGNIAPMLGLLGTVLGMVIAFGELATSDGLAKNLAQGIYFALVTTVDGLLVAIPALLAFSFFNNRVAVVAAELTHRVEGTLRPLRRGIQPSPAPRGPLPHVKVSGLQELK